MIFILALNILRILAITYFVILRAEIPSGPVTVATPPVAAAAAAAQPGAADVGQNNAPDGVNGGGPADAAPLLPQDVHTAAVANAVHSTRVAAQSQRNGRSSRMPQSFPAFFVVTAGPDLAVLSDPSKEGKQVRRIKKVDNSYAELYSWRD